jgi:hypothetical protein
VSTIASGLQLSQATFCTALKIAVFLFGDRKHRRRVYNLVEGNALPTFRVGVNICEEKRVAGLDFNARTWDDAQAVFEWTFRFIGGMLSC